MNLKFFYLGSIEDIKSGRENMVVIGQSPGERGSTCPNKGYTSWLYSYLSLSVSCLKKHPDVIFFLLAPSCTSGEKAEDTRYIGCATDK